MSTSGVAKFCGVVFSISSLFSSGLHAESQGITLLNNTVVLNDIQLIESEGIQIITGDNDNFESTIIPKRVGWSSLTVSELNLPSFTIEDYQKQKHIFSTNLPQDHALIITIKPCHHFSTSHYADTADCVMRKSAVLLQTNTQSLDQVSATDSSGDSIALFAPGKKKEKHPDDSQPLQLSTMIISIAPDKSFISGEGEETASGYGYFSPKDSNDYKKHRPSGSCSEYLFNQLDFQLKHHILSAIPKLVSDEWAQADFIKPLDYRANNKPLSIKRSYYDSWTGQPSTIQINMLFIPFESSASLPEPEHIVMTWVAENMNEGELFNFYNRITNRVYPLTKEQFHQNFINSDGYFNVKEFYDFVIKYTGAKSMLFESVKQVLFQGWKEKISQGVKDALDKILGTLKDVKTVGAGVVTPQATERKSTRFATTRSVGRRSGPGEIPRDYIQGLSEIFGSDSSSHLSASGGTLHDSSHGVTISTGNPSVQFRTLSKTPGGATGLITQYRRPNEDSQKEDEDD